MSSSASATPSASSTSASGSIALPSQLKIVGILLAVVSGLLIGSSFVFKKKGLLKSQKGYEAGEGVAYLKSPMWWIGMTMMILGEICNFVAYAFVEAIVVTPLGALSVVISAILSSLFLNEKLTFFGWIGCGLCIIGSTVIALNGPQEETVGQIVEFQHLFLSVGFLIWGGLLIVASVTIMVYFGPKYGKKSMLWYLFVCSMIGGLSVSCTTGLGASIVTTVQGQNQFKHWFIYFLLIFVSVTLVTEVLYLNKALALFNTAMVTPTYYVIFTFFTLVTSVILFQGLKSSVMQILTIVCGFLTICCGITILQMSKIDPTQLNKLDRKSTLLLQASRRDTESAEKSIMGIEEPGIDALRGSFGTIGSIIRARSAHRMSMSSRSGSGTVRSRHGNDSQNNLFGSEGLGSRLPGAGPFQRHQLYDPPVPRLVREDSTDRISLKSDLSGMSGSTLPPLPKGTPRTPTIKFESQDVAHYYPQPGTAGGSRHEHVQAATGGGNHAPRDSSSSLPPIPPTTPHSLRVTSPEPIEANLTPRPKRGRPDTDFQTALASETSFSHTSPYRDPFAKAPTTTVQSDFATIPEAEERSPPHESPSKRKLGRRSGHRHYPRSGSDEDREESIGLVDRERPDLTYNTSSDSDVPAGNNGGVRLVTSSATRI